MQYFSVLTYEDLSHFQQTFTQPIPFYGVKSVKTGWAQVDKTLSQRVCQEHLLGTRIVGTLGRWYPAAAIFDIDDRSLAEVAEIRAALGLNQHNSMLFSSESADSYHLYFKAKRYGKAVTLRYCQAAFKNFCRFYQIEFYPQTHHVIRLPFSRHSQFLDRPNDCLNALEAMHYFDRLDDFELSTMADFSGLDCAYEQAKDTTPPLLFPLDDDFHVNNYTNWKAEGLAYLNTGLTQPHSRLEASKRLIYFYWSQNVALEQTKLLVRLWLKEKHHGFSQDYLNRRNKTLQSTDKLVDWFYNSFEKHYFLPETAHLLDKGYLTEESLTAIIHTCQGNLPRMRFLANLSSYCAPRQHYQRLAVHSDRLKEWSSKTNYLKYLDELKQKNIIERLDGYQGYRIDHYAKELRFKNWSFGPSLVALRQADGRPVETFEEAVKVAFTGQEYRALLKKAGLTKQASSIQIKRIFA